METDKPYIELLTELKKKIRQAQHRVALSLNTEMLVLYWSMGNDISAKIKEAGWGSKVVDQMSKDLKDEFPEMNGFSPRNLRYMRSFAEAYSDFLQADLAKSEKAILQPVVALIPWTNHTIILDRVKSIDDRLLYIRKTAENGW